MSALSDEYIKNFSKERKSIFNKRFRDDYDPNMSERSNIIRILNEMRELGLADGGRIGLKEGLGSFETSDPKEAMKEVIKRFLEKNIETTTVPISENIFLNLAPGVSDVELGGIMKILGGELGFGASKDKGIGFNFKKEFNKGGRVAYQDGTPDRQLYETPVTDAIKSVNEKTIDAIQKGGELFDKYSGIGDIDAEVRSFPGSFDDATGQPSDFRHQAASNLLAEALGKGKAGPLGYISGGVGSLALGTGKEVIDFFKGVLDENTTTKEAFDQAIEDTISNYKGAFAPAGTTTQDLYDELMAGYVPIGPFGMDRTSLLRSQQLFAQRKKALEDAAKKRKDIKNFIEQKDTTAPLKKPTKPITGTTKPGTGGGGGGFTPTTTAQNIARTTSRVEDGRVKAYGLAKGGIARMLGE